MNEKAVFFSRRANAGLNTTLLLFTMETCFTVYFVVIFTQPPETYIGYTIARVIDTGVGVLVGLLVNISYHLPKESKEAQVPQELSVSNEMRHQTK